MIRNHMAGSLAGAGLAIATCLTIAGTAHAAPSDYTTVSDRVIAYAKSHGDGFCAAMQAYPTRKGATDTVEWITERGFSYEEAGQILMLSMHKYCPERTTILRELFGVS
jgi:hypothetical protein